MENKFRSKSFPYDIVIGKNDIRLIPYKKFKKIMLETNNPQLHDRIISLFNPNSEHWLKKFIDMYLIEDKK